MKFLFTADIHLHNHNDKDFDHNGLPMKLVETIDAMNQLCTYAVANNIPTIIIGGDLNHTKEVASVRAFALFKSLLDGYPGLEFIIIPGNHDMTSKEGIETAVDLLRGPSNIKVVPTVEKIDNVVLLPFSSTMFDELAEVSDDDNSSNILISHFGLSDAQLSNGCSIRTRLSSADLKGWGLVLLGHYHKPQQIDNAYYVGSPIPFRRDEFNEEKRFLVVDSDTLDVQSVPVEGYRKYYRLVIDDKENAKEILEQAQQLMSEGNFVSVRKTIKDEIIDSPVTVINDYVEEHIQRGITTNMELNAQMQKWLEIENIPEEHKARFMEIGLKGLSFTQQE